MPKLTDRQRLARMINWLERVSVERSRILGGYPDDIACVADFITVASLDHDGAPVLVVYHPAVSLWWYRRILRYRKRHPEACLSECVQETEPSEDQAQEIEIRYQSRFN